MRILHKTTFIIFVLLCGLALVTVTGADAAKVIKLHHLNKDDPFDNPTGAMATVFKSLVEAGTTGTVTVQTSPSGQLGKANAVGSIRTNLRDYSLTTWRAGVRK